MYIFYSLIIFRVNPYIQTYKSSELCFRNNTKTNYLTLKILLMKLKSFIKLGLAAVVLMPLFLTSTTSCASRYSRPAQVTVNTGGGNGKYVPTSRKEVRLMKKAQRKGVY